MLRTEDAVRAYAVMMNTLDVSKFEPLLANDFHYASQWVFHEIESKQEYLEYITRKLRAIKKSGLKVWAELAESNNGPCVVVAEGGKDNILSVVFAKVKDNKMERMDMCMLSLYSGKRSGEYPT
jgi:hypothetical protein